MFVECGLGMLFKRRNTSSDVCVSSDRTLLEVLQFTDNLFEFLLLSSH